MEHNSKSSNTNLYLKRLNSFTSDIQYKFTAISLFSGGGGLDLGVNLAGFKSLFVSDLIPTYVDTIKQNLPHVKTYTKDATVLTPEEILQLADAKDVDLMVAGPPCQSFSILGQRKALEDPRGQLTIKYFKLIAGVKPKAFIVKKQKMPSSKKREMASNFLLFYTKPYFNRAIIVSLPTVESPTSTKISVSSGKNKSTREPNFINPRCSLR